MKARLRGLIDRALADARAAGELASTETPEYVVEVPREEGHGDLATNVAMMLAKPERKSPRAIADIVARHLARAELVDRAESAGPGFLNVTFADAAWRTRLLEILSAGDEFGQTGGGRGKRIQVEFCSANPTGPLHIGHGRGAATGDGIARLLEATGYDVEREYYINDAGVQMERIGRSVFYRYLELLGRRSPDDFPEDCYPGDYVTIYAQEIIDVDGERWAGLPEPEVVAYFGKRAGDAMLEKIREDLAIFGVEFDNFTSERELAESSRVLDAIEELRSRGHVYDEGGATWMRTTAFADDKDRPVIKSDGSLTYFASDICYHREKMKKGFDRLIDVWGADHHGYISRTRASLQALGYDADRLRVVLVQMVSLSRDGQPVRMGKRSGEFITLRDVLDEVGPDLARFFFLSRRSDAHLDFDLELARRQTAENPVFYVQYAHTRIAGIFRQVAEKDLAVPDASDESVAALGHPDEIAMVKLLAEFPEIVAGAAEALEPHRVIFYAQKVAGEFHRFYSKHRFVSEDAATTGARLLLARAVGQVLGRALRLVGIAAPERM
ncbi:MAG TPA: arginine--tRNA ligase [Candidatus Limnocylindrales bacterium]|nr:arginine--tRNA ligase [Candidatus Limnocylindrales bacterium]